MSDDGEVAASASAAPSETALDNDDILGQVLLRLPPLPSSLPRASLVCKRWRRLVSSPPFLRSFRRHHRKPPLLGLLYQDSFGDFAPSEPRRYNRALLQGYLGGRRSDVHFITFVPTLSRPDLIPPARFSLRLDAGSQFLGCRHGRVLVLDKEKLHFLVWDPMTGDQRIVAFPPVFCDRGRYDVNGAIACAASDRGHVHGSCHLSPFQIVMIGRGCGRMLACVYSSDTGAWGNLTSIFLQQDIIISPSYPNALVGNSICWFSHGGSMAILQFDLGRQSLSITDAPRNAFDMDAFFKNYCQLMITSADHDELGFLVFSSFTAQLWKRQVNSNGVAGWTLRSTIELNSHLPVMTWKDTPMILGISEDDNAMIVLTDDGVAFKVNLESGKFEKLPARVSYCLCYPFACFYTGGIGIPGGQGVELLPDA